MPYVGCPWKGKRGCAFVVNCLQWNIPTNINDYLFVNYCNRVLVSLFLGLCFVYTLKES